MYYRVEFDIYNFPFWSGARDRMQNATSDQIEQVKERIEEYFGYDEEAPTETEINDLVWFECDDIFDAKEDEDLEEGCGKPSKKLDEAVDEKGNFKFSDAEIAQVGGRKGKSDKKYKIYQNGGGEIAITPHNLNGSWILMDDSNNFDEVFNTIQTDWEDANYILWDQELLNDSDVTNYYPFDSIEEEDYGTFVFDLSKYYVDDLEEGCGKPSKEVKESDEDDTEWKVVRQNAKANPSLYGGRYADKDSRKAKKEWLKDRKEQSLNEEDEEIEIDLEDWGLGDLKEDDEKRPSNRFKSDPKLYSHKKLEDLRAKHSDDDIDKVYKLSGEEVRSHNKWLKRKGKDNLMQEANGFKKVVDKHLNKKPVKVKALRESLEEFSSDFPEFEEFSAEETFENPEDCICMNVPLTMRVLEYAKESNLTDEDLHNIVEKATSMCADGKCLSMDDYDSLIEKDSEDINESNENARKRKYAIQYHDMNKGNHNLIIFDNLKDAKKAYSKLLSILDQVENEQIDNEDYFILMDNIFNNAIDTIEINYRDVEEKLKYNQYEDMYDNKYIIINKDVPDLW